MVRAKTLQKYGEQFKIIYEDGNTDLAVPNGSGMWIVSAASGGGGGSGGDFSWPYPLDYVTSEFGPRGTGFHEGMDWSGGPALAGDDIPAIGDGEVYAAGFSGAFGNRVILYHGELNGYDRYSLYAHMVSTPAVSAGDNVSKGDVLGQIGNTGNSFGAHLHMEIHRVSPGGNLVWANNNPSWTGTGRTPQDPRRFMNTFGDGEAIIT